MTGIMEEIKNELHEEADRYVEEHMDLTKKLEELETEYERLRIKIQANLEILEEQQLSVQDGEVDPNSPPITYRMIFYFRNMEKYRAMMMVMEARIERIKLIIEAAEQYVVPET